MKNQKRKILLMVDNLESIDQESMEILLSQFMDNGRDTVMLVGGYDTTYSFNRRTLAQLEMMDNVRLCPLIPLNRTETAAYLSIQSCKSTARDLDFSEIWLHTGGSVMLLDDVSNHISSGDCNWYAPSAATLKRLEALRSSMTPDERNCLEILSIFRYGVEPRVLSKIMGVRTAELASILERLCQRELVTEEDFESQPLAVVTPDMLRQSIYLQISRLRRLMLHRAAAGFYRQSRGSGPQTYHQLRELKYHYEMAGWSYERIYYALEELRHRLDYCDDFFPTLHNTPEVLGTFYLSKSDTYQEFDRIGTSLRQMSSQLSQAQINELDMTCKYLKGRTLIRDSRGEEGLRYIYSVIQTAASLGREDMLLKAYLEVIFSGLRTENEPLMREYIKKLEISLSFPSMRRNRLSCCGWKRCVIL